LTCLYKYIYGRLQQYKMQEFGEIYIDI
jgi:hypothetical protein